MIVDGSKTIINGLNMHSIHFSLLLNRYGMNNSMRLFLTNRGNS